MRPFPLVRVLCALAAVPFLASSTPCGETQCTLIGCLDGVRFEIRDSADRLVRNFDVEVEIDGGVESISCPQADQFNPHLQCQGDGELFVETTAPRIRVGVVSSKGAFDGEIVPEYQEHFPNGEECGPACVNARAVLRLQP